MLVKKVRRKKPKDYSDLSDPEVLFELLEFKNPLTRIAAKIYQEKSSQPMLYCIILAGKMYEEELLSVGMIKTYFDDFDVEEYSQCEMNIFQSMRYCLYI